MRALCLSRSHQLERVHPLIPRLVEPALVICMVPTHPHTAAARLNTGHNARAIQRMSQAWLGRANALSYFGGDMQAKELYGHCSTGARLAGIILLGLAA